MPGNNHHQVKHACGWPDSYGPEVGPMTLGFDLITLEMSIYVLMAERKTAGSLMH